MPKIKTIPKYEMKKVKQRSPSLIDEMFLIGEFMRNTDDIDDIIYGKRGLNYEEETETLHQEREGQI